MKPANASSVMLHICLADTRSKCGAGGGPFLLLDSERVRLLPCESTDVVEALLFVFFRRVILSEESRGEPEDAGDRRLIEGRTSFFCLEAGRISSRSTGTPRETRKSRRIRERIQFGGWSGGGATSWDQREALRGVRNIGLDAVKGGSIEVSMMSAGKRRFIYGSVALRISS